MENKSPTQQTLTSEEQAIKDRVNKKKTALKAVKDNLNYIYIVLMVIANCIISLLKIEDGEIGLAYPKNGMGWALWITRILITTFIGVMILNAFRRQGVKNGHGVIKETYDKYLEAVANNTKDKNPRNLKEYLREKTIKDSFSKGTILILINLLVMSLVISANLNALLALITNIIFAVAFGIKAMLDAEEYVLQELIVWYKIKINELNKEKEKENERKLQRDTQFRPRHRRTSRVQPKEEPTTRQPSCDSIGTSNPDSDTDTSRLLA